jgi:hypothetical protein
MTSRRAFIAALLSAPVIGRELLTDVPSRVPAFYFDPAKQYGNYGFFSTEDVLEELIDELVENARSVLPSGAKFDVFVHMPLPGHVDPLARAGSAGWKYPSRGEGHLVRMA